MDSTKSSDLYKEILARLLADVQRLQSDVLTPKALNCTVKILYERCACEGLSFLTKTLPLLGKALDRALSSETQQLVVPVSFQKLDGTQLPRFLGELFSRVFDGTGTVLTTPCVVSVRHLRQILYLFYKLELPYKPSQEQEVIDRFLATESDIRTYDERFQLIADYLDRYAETYRTVHPRLAIITRNRNSSEETLSLLGAAPCDPEWGWRIISGARKLLSRLFRDFDSWDITPGHGPGSVSTKEEMDQKYTFGRINPRIEETYPYAQYYCASAGHVCDWYKAFEGLQLCESFAKVCLVAKDSRGPRLISAEPLENQWVQQGLGRAIVRHVERHFLTRDSVRFTDQTANQNLALLGSREGKYATLDLKDASDRVTCGLVNLLFPGNVQRCLMACRSLATTLPDGRVIALKKYAPMGSALCFPVLALTIWALLQSAATNLGSKTALYVYGDDIVIDSAFAEHATIVLESFGLTVNRDKSCMFGFFRESCGMDAFRGVQVTPVRLRTVWDNSDHPIATDMYTSYIEFSNNLWTSGYTSASIYIADRIKEAAKFPIPSASMGFTSCPSLLCEPPNEHLFRKRVNSALQRVEYKVPTIKSVPYYRGKHGWLMLLRFLTSRGTLTDPLDGMLDQCRSRSPWDSALKQGDIPGFQVRQYTRRRETKVSWRWRAV